ncbi:MAG: type II toxin-antitoxin system RelE/ParE family toxin [Sulfuricellaceae bacterium]|nr:type II toxin-antitoxin system RelE/ParE family toxin [Sulfuricellaceae bacterium]
MPQVIFTPVALGDIERLREFLRSKNPLAAKRAGESIVKAIRILEQQPQIGRPVQDMPPDFRDFIVEFGDSGFVVRYRYTVGSSIVVLTVKHQKEAGFSV